MTRNDLIELILLYVGPRAETGPKEQEFMANILKRTGMDSPAADRLWGHDRGAFCDALRDRCNHIGELLARRSPQRALDPYVD